MKRYFYMDSATFIKRKNIVILSNKYTGTWIKVPLDCWEIIANIYNKGENIYDGLNLIREEDKKYFLKIIRNLEIMHLLCASPYESVNYNMVPNITISLTDSCNLSCEYCCKNSSYNKKSELNLSEMRKAIDNIMKLKPININISGGEPLLRVDFTRIIDYIRQTYDGNLILSTNGVLINNEMAKYVSENFNLIEISLDGYDEESCSHIRGKNIFNKVISAVKRLQYYGMKKINLSMVVGEYNKNYIKDFENLNIALGTNMRIRYFCKFGRGELNFDKYINDDDVFYQSDSEYDGVNYLKTGHCNAGRNQLFINNDGYIYPCPNVIDDDYKVGNILEFNDDKIEKIYKLEDSGFENFKSLNLQNVDRCKDCDVNLFCNTCPAKNRLLLNNIKAFNKYCDYNGRNIKRIIWNS